MTDLATLTARLAEAESALHGLLTGRASVTLRAADGKSVTYQMADVAALRSHVGELKAAMDEASGGRGRRPIAVRF